MQFGIEGALQVAGPGKLRLQESGVETGPEDGDFEHQVARGEDREPCGDVSEGGDRAVWFRFAGRGKLYREDHYIVPWSIGFFD